MQPNIRTSNSQHLVEINDFPYIADLCRISKCRYFFLHQATNSMFGVRDDICTLHQIPIPYAIHTDLLFRNGLLDPEVLNKYSDYFVPEKFPWTIVPTAHYEAYKQGLFYTFERKGYGQLMLARSDTHELLEYFPTLKIHDEFVVPLFMSQLDGFFTRMQRCGPAYTFTDMEKDPVVRKVYDAKTSEGRSILKLKCGDQWAAFYIYKSMFPLNMNDKLTIQVRFDKLFRNEMLISFYPKRKNSPLARNTYRTPYSQITHMCHLNLV